MTKIEWISISGPEGKTAIDNFINGQPDLDVVDTIELGTDIGIIYHEVKAKKEKKPKKSKETKLRKSKR
jgi:hypothetical protein